MIHCLNTLLKVWNMFATPMLKPQKIRLLFGVITMLDIDYFPNKFTIKSYLTEYFAINICKYIIITVYNCKPFKYYHITVT